MLLLRAYIKCMNTPAIRIPTDIVALLSNRILFRLGFGLVGVFTPIFFYDAFGQSLYALLAVYILLNALNVFVTPLGSMLLKRMGVRGLLAVSIPFAVLSVVGLYVGVEHPFLAVALFLIGSTFFHSLYWVPFHTDLGHVLNKKHAGTRMVFFHNAAEVMNTVTPLVGGALILVLGFQKLFILAGMVLLSTLIPTYFIQEIYERYAWGYWETFRHLFAYKNRALLYAYTADGAQSIITAVVWPVFVFELLHQNYLSVGFVTSLTTIAVLMLNVVVGKFVDHVGEAKALTYSSILSASGWVVKFFVDSAFQVFVADTYHRLGRTVNQVTFDAATYEHSADNGHYIDEFTTLKEMALNIGRVLMLSGVAGLLWYLGNIRLVFIIAAGATMAMVALNRQMTVR